MADGKGRRRAAVSRPAAGIGSADVGRRASGAGWAAEASTRTADDGGGERQRAAAVGRQRQRLGVNRGVLHCLVAEGAGDEHIDDLG